MISKLIEDLKRDEGWREYAYDDKTGKPVACDGWVTIGYGFLIDARKNGHIPREIAEAWLELLAEEKWAELVQELPWLLTEPEDVQRAVTNMAYQLGVQGVLQFKLMLGALERGDRETAAVNALDSLWARQTPERARRVADLMRGFSDG